MATFLLPDDAGNGCLSAVASRNPMVAVCGGGATDPETAALAESVGRELARAGVTLVCGGLGGVMEEACRGARQAGGRTVGILPGDNTAVANPFVDVPIATGMSHGRNAVIVHTADAVLALKGSYGTLSEIALALKMGKPVATVGDWCPLHEVAVFHSAAAAVQGLLSALTAD